MHFLPEFRLHPIDDLFIYLLKSAKKNTFGSRYSFQADKRRERNLNATTFVTESHL